jgi:hypothetical protein
MAFITPVMFVVPDTSVIGVALRFGCALLFSMLLINSSRRFLGVVAEPTGFTARIGLQEVFVRWENVEAARSAWFRMIRVNTTVGVCFVPASIAQDSRAVAILNRLAPDHPLRATVQPLAPDGP